MDTGLQTSARASAASAAEWLVSPDLVPYPEAQAVMESRVDDIIDGRKPELIWLLQHPPLYTGGTSADTAELKDKARFPIYETGRGGRYTYHGPGQRVIYAMIDLRERGKDLRAHIWRLEEWMIRALADFGVRGERREGRIGIWVVRPQNQYDLTPPPPSPLPRGEGESFVEEKIGAIGVRVRKWVAYHGLALNIDPDLSHFSGIVPCGISEFGVTSLHKLGIAATMNGVDQAFKRHVDIALHK